MPRTIVALSLLNLLLSVAPRCEAIVIRHDRRDADHRALAVDWPQAVELGKRGGAGVATLIASQWLLTAAHVSQYKTVGQEVFVGDEGYEIVAIHPHPGFKLQPIQHDISLIQLDREVVGVEPVRLYAKSEEVGKEVLFVGSGDSGTGVTGPHQRDRVRRAATNRVVDATPLWLTFRFDPPGEALYHEGISGPGDSGGAALAQIDSTIWILGVSSWQDTAPTNRSEGRYGVIEHYTRVSTHLDWIQSAMASQSLDSGADRAIRR